MNLTALKKFLTANNGQRSVYVSGPPGSGKSSIINQIYEEQEMDFFGDVRLGTMDSVEVKGIMIPDLKNKCTIATLPEYFPPESSSSDTRGILFLDEFDHALPSTQSAAYQLVLDRKIGKFKLPDGVWVVCASNSKIDGGVHYQVPRPIKNRVIQVSAKADLAEWLLHAQAEVVHSTILAFVRQNPEFLYYESKEDSAMPNSLKAFASPRSWFSADTVVSNEDEEFLSDRALIQEVLEGTIGYTATKNYLAFLDRSQTTLDLDKILKGEFEGMNSADFANIPAVLNILAQLETYITHDALSVNKTQEGVLEFIDRIHDADIKSLVFRSVNGRAKRILNPVKKEENALLLRAKILSSVKM